MFPSSTLWKYTFREMQRRPGRTLLTLLGIMIGVANVFAIGSTIQATRQAYRTMHAAVGGRASLEVVATGGGGFDEALARDLRLEEVAGVQSAVNGIQTTAGLVRPNGILPVLVLGIDPAQDARARSYRLHSGEPLQVSTHGLLIGRTFAESQGLHLGSVVKLRTFTRVESLPIVGLLEPEGPALFNGGAVVILPLPSAQELFGMKGQVNTIQVVLHDDCAVSDAERRLNERLATDTRASGLRVQTPPSRGDIAHTGLAPHEQAFSTLSVVGLVGGAFVVLNSFLMNLTERRRQLAILRALGTTRSQLTRLLLREALLLGIVGTLFGIGLGHLLATVLVRIHEMFLGLELPALQPSLTPYLLALLVGPGMAVLATLWPAIQAGRRSPLQALLPKIENTEEPMRRWPRWVGLSAVGVALLFAIGVANSWWPVEISNALLPVIMIFLLVGAVLFLPLVLQPLLPLTARLLGPVFGIEGALAFRQLQRQPMRTSLTIGVLFIGMIVTVGFGNSLLNNIADIDTWYERTLPSDYLVRTHMPDAGTMTASPLPGDLAREIHQIDGVTDVGKVSFVITRTADDLQCLVFARSILPERPLSLALVEGTDDEVRAAMLRGEIVIGSVLAQRTGKHAGDTLTLQTRHGPLTVRIAGVAKEYSASGMALYWDWEHANAALELPGVHAFEIFVDPDKRTSSQPAVQAFCERHSLLLQTNQDLRDYISNVVRAVNAFLWILIALVFLIASMGIVNTLTMNVHEQTRELGVLRAVGMKRGQVRKLMLAQGVLIGLLGVGLGALVGLVVAVLMQYSTYGLTGHRVVFHLQGPFLLLCCGVGMLIAVLAAVIPANRAARIEVLDALRYE